MTNSPQKSATPNKKNTSVVCEKCGKMYKNLKTLNQHFKRFHFSTKYHKNAEKSAVKNATKTQNDMDDGDKLIQLQCNGCKKIYSRKDSLLRHKGNCKGLNNVDVKITNLEKENMDLKKKILELENKIKKIYNVNDSDKIPKRIQDINDKLDKISKTNINNINNGTINNGTINNIINVNIVELGKENLIENLSSKEQLSILKRQYSSVDYLIEYVHCNDKFKQYQNIIITNCRNNVGYKYDEKSNKFIAINKDELLNDIVNERISDIQDFNEIHYDKLDDKTKSTLSKFLNKIQKDKKFKNQKKNDINFLMYNNSNKIISKFDMKCLS